MALRTGLAEWALTPFESQQHLIEALRDPQYSRVPEYRAACEKKMCIDTKGAQISVYDDTQRSAPPEAGMGQSKIGPCTEAETRLAYEEGQAEAQRLHAQTYGPLSVKPAPRILTRLDLEADAWNRQQWRLGTEAMRRAEPRDDER